MVEYADDDLRGSRFLRVDLSGSRWHGVVLENVRITDAWVESLDISGRIGTLTVNGVDVSDYVSSELDRRHPERRMLAATDVDGLRAAWAMVGEQAQATVQRARSLPDAALNESVDGEFSFLQTLRHLVFATDRWISGPVFDDELARIVDSPNGGTTSVMSCIHVVLREEWAHNRYANRDLDVLIGG